MKNSLLYVLIAVAVLAIGYKLAYPKMPAEDMIAKVVDIASGTVADAMSGVVDGASGVVADVVSGVVNTANDAVDTVVNADSYTVIANSKLNWLGEKVGGSHPGTINISKGTALVKDGKLVGGSIEIDMNSITTTDDAGTTLDTHLKSNDFFDVERYPTAEFVFKNYDGTMLVGDLTIKGITKTLGFPATVTMDNNKLSIKATTNIERAARQIGEGNAVISPYFRLDFDITFGK